MVCKREEDEFGYSLGPRRRGTVQFVLHMGYVDRWTVRIPRHRRAAESKGRVMTKKVTTKMLATVRESPNEYEARIECSLVRNGRV